MDNKGRKECVINALTTETAEWNGFYYSLIFSLEI